MSQVQQAQFKVSKAADEAFSLEEGLSSGVGRAPERRPPILLGDRQLHSFLANGYLRLQTSLPDDFHARMHVAAKRMLGHLAIDNPGNNFLPLTPELLRVVDDPAIKGALISVLGPDFWLHPHRYPHDNPPGSEEQVWHHDSYWGYKRKVHDHRPWWVMIMYYPQEVYPEIGPTGVAAGTYCFAQRPDDIDALGYAASGPAGTCLMIHYDVWHRKMKNVTQNERFMLKFEFTRMSRPEAPGWACEDTAWRLPDDLPGHRVDELYRQQWYWLAGMAPPRVAAPVEGGEVERLVEALSSGAPKARRDAALALGRLGPAAAPAISALKAALHDGFEPASLNAAYALSAIGEPTIPALIEVLLGNDGESVDDPRILVDEGQHAEVEMPARNAAHALVGIGVAASAPLVAAYAGAGPRVRKYIAYALGQIGAEDASVYEVLEAGAADPDVYVRISAVEALGLMRGRPQAVRALLHAMRDAEDEVRFNAVQSIARLAPKEPAVIAALEDALYDGNRYVVGYALEALDRIGTREAQALLIPFLKAARWCPKTNPKSQF
ncbi:MAG: HEAT repeat domain-containing protein [Alphaproteobacteria bacterium]